MIEFLISQLTSWAGWIIAGLAGFGVIWLQRWRNQRLKEKIDEQDRAIGAYKVKEEVHRHDQETTSTTDQQIDDLRHRVDAAGSDEDAARIAADELDGYFGPLGRKD